MRIIFLNGKSASNFFQISHTDTRSQRWRYASIKSQNLLWLLIKTRAL